ncbi:uncharacterized protein LOC135690534 [Rhopilema esculentum]|uniref:uncharacterized protein LOC135690534 n=1 Tax=Rhopilema esculentum TaxID=499914 RepID=UPI0031CE1A22|eukprot:gene3293-1625_t
MALSGGMPGSVSALLAEQESCYMDFAEALKRIVTSKTFDKESFKNRPLNISEAYVLLWQNMTSGSIDGKSNMNLRVGAFAAVLVDLLVRDKVEIVNDVTHLGSDQNQKYIVKVLDTKPTGTYLDNAGFSKILAYQKANSSGPRLLETWLEEGREDAVTPTLKNLIERKILGDVHTGLFGTLHKYPTKDASFETALDAEMKQVSLKECKPDSFMLSLLTLSRTADNLFTFVDPILRKHFTKDEYKVAKENIKVIVQSQGEVLRSPKLDRKKLKILR